MTFWFRPRIRHPFFPGMKPTPACEAKGRAPALCGAFADLEQAAARGISAERAVFVVIRLDAPRLTAAQRDRIWELFETPVYTILTDGEDRVAAYECEVQNGFHLAGSSGDEAVCECGRPGPMIGVKVGIEQRALQATTAEVA